MAIRRRRSSRRFAGRKGGRQFWWIRFTPFSLDLVEAVTATHSAIMLTESDWQNPQSELNSTQRGGARLERLIMDFGLSINAAPGFYTAGGSANIALIPEFMVWKQADTFFSLVISSASFDAIRETHRVIMDEVPGGEREFQNLTPGGTNTTIRSLQGHYETKSKVRLADSALGVAFRGSFNTGDGMLSGYTDWVRPTMLISVP